MNLLADENVDRQIVERLRHEGLMSGILLNAFSVVTIGAIRIRHEID